MALSIKMRPTNYDDVQSIRTKDGSNFLFRFKHICRAPSPNMA